MDDGYYRFRKPLACIAALLLLFLLSACNGETPSPTASVPQPTSVQPTRTLTPFQPSPTPQLLAARVNGDAITLDQFHAELARYQVTVGTQLATEDEQRVIQDMVDRLLLAQAAAEAGYDVDEAAVQNRMDELATRLGDDQALVDWMARHGYTHESFRHDLALSMAAAWMRDQIAAGVPAAVEQVHARQILLYNSEDASEVLVQLSAGADFAALAAEYDPVGKGDLGWFPRGYLLEPELDAAAFELQPGELSDIIETGIGFHILQIEERETARTLEQDARLALQMLAVQDWLVERRGVSDIEILLP
jgi:peptidyl-prolyl cis-trans isomerase C